MYELADFIVRSLIDEGQAYTIDYNERSGELVIYVCKESIGKVIGKQGRIAKAIRSIIKASAIKKDVRVNVDIKEMPEEA